MQQALKCHYRSKHEGLIDFSNRHFYEGDLTSFPSPAGPDAAPVRWVHLRDGAVLRDDNGKRVTQVVNPVEAEAVRDEILRRLDDPVLAEASIGVVTMNAAQMSLVENMLNDLEDPRIAALLEDRSDRGLFVRNLESVQGDERDVILISVGYAHDVGTTEHGETRRRMMYRFGPLNNEGGERRWNVAVTRAREEVVIYSSFRPEELEDAKVKAVGLRRLKQYLQEARPVRPGLAAAASVGAAPDVGLEGSDAGAAETNPSRDRDLHRTAIADELRSRGWRVQEDLGLSDFRIDIAVGREGADEWVLAVLLDGPRWSGRPTVYDRDVLPVSILAGIMGWPNVHRVWLPLWIHHREEVLADIDAALERTFTVVDALADESVSDVPMPDQPDQPDPEDRDVEITPPVPDEPEPPAAVGSSPRPDQAPTTAPGHDQGQQRVGPTESATADHGSELLGPKDVLDDLRDENARELVRRAMHDAIGDVPISTGDLARAVGARFGYAKLRANRVEAILRLVPTTQLRTSRLGDFVWPVDLDPETWTGFQSPPPGERRDIEGIAPEELVNAMVSLLDAGGRKEEEALAREVSALFGNQRFGARIQRRLTDVTQWAVRNGRLEVDAESGEVGLSTS